MHRYSRLITQIPISILWSWALVSLVFPPQLFAQSSRGLSALAGLRAESHLLIEVLEMEQGDDMPGRFQVSVDGYTLVFELSERDGVRGYTFTEESDRSQSGFQPLPDLHDIMSWKIERDDTGFFQAQIPAAQLGYRAGGESTPDGNLSRGRPGIDTFGYYDPENRSFEMTALLDGVGAMDISFSLARLDGDPLGDGQKAVVIAVPLATILAILGVVALTCAALFVAATFICNQQCPWGVQSAKAMCIPVLSLTCTCHSPPAPPRPLEPCIDAPPEDVILMPLEGTVNRALGGDEIRLERLEQSSMQHDGKPMSYLMAEWAVVRHGVGGGIEVLRSSSDAFGEAEASTFSGELARAVSGNGGDQIALLLAIPPHGANSRTIPIPSLRFDGDAGTRKGRVLVRADFSENRSLQDLTVLADTLGGASPELVEALAAGLSLQFEDSRRHRAISFAVLEVGENPRIESIQTYIPRCCCGLNFCS